MKQKKETKINTIRETNKQTNKNKETNKKIKTKKQITQVINK
jgi:hypothetical protein